MYIDKDLTEENSWYSPVSREEQEQERSVQLNALCRVYEQADRVLTGDPIIVNVEKDGPAPAWSDGASITINLDEITSMDLESLTQVNGLNYHELAHHLYSPRRGTTLVQWVLEQGYMQSFNILEDQRIETLITARYPSIAPYLVATVARWLGTEESADGVYMAIRGRRYLPLEIRQSFRKEFRFPDLIPSIINIVDQYRLLSFPKDYDTAKDLIKRFQDEVLTPAGITDQFSGGPNCCGSRGPVSKGRPEPGKSQSRDAARGGGMGTPEDDSTQTPDAPTPTAEEALQKREQSQRNAEQQGGGRQYGEGHVDSVGGLPQNIHDLLNNAVEDVLSRKDVQMDIKAKQRVIVGGDGKYDDTLKAGRYDSTSIPQDAVLNYRKFARELQRLRDDSEPTWERETPSGKLNIQRVIKGCEISNAFDRWDEGNDGCDVEAVILVDRSGSMSSQQNDLKASIACWTIKRSLEQINAPVTVYAFDDKSEVAYRRDEHVSKSEFKFIYGSGGTNPYNTLISAEQLLMSSRKKNKMLFVITDGVFNNDKNDDVIERIAKRGVLTVMTLIMSDSDEEFYRTRYSDNDLTHKAEIFGRIQSAADLVPFAKKVVTASIKKRAGR